MRNNISFDNIEGAFHPGGSNTISDHNTWDGIAVDGADFTSLNPGGVDGPRGQHNTLPILLFMRLANGSNLIDAGVDIGRPFNGAAPDLGAFESD